MKSALKLWRFLYIPSVPSFSVKFLIFIRLNWVMMKAFYYFILFTCFCHYHFYFFVFVFTSTYIIKFPRYIIVETKGGKKYVIFSIEKFEGSLKKKYCISASINTIIYNSLFRLGLYYFQTIIYKRLNKDDLMVWSFEVFS